MQLKKIPAVQYTRECILYNIEWCEKLHDNHLSQILSNGKTRFIRLPVL